MSQNQTHVNQKIDIARNLGYNSLQGLRNIIEALGGVVEIAKQTDTELDTLLEVLSSDNAPRIDTLNTIINALGCRLSIESIEVESPNAKVKDENYTIAQRKTTTPSFEVTTD